MNKIIEALIERRSIRKYKNEQVKTQELQEILEAGTYAPSAKNVQPTKIVAVQNKTQRDKIAIMNAKVLGIDSDPYYGAPTIVIVFADQTRPTYIEDGTLVMANILNAAHAMGLGSCWINRGRQVFESEEGKEMKKEWDIEDNYVCVGTTTVGYLMEQNPKPAPRKHDFIKIVK